MSPAKNKAYFLSFDIFQRYKAIEEIVNRLRNKKRLRVLDIGGGRGDIKYFLPNDDVIIFDKHAKEGKGYRSGDALRLPFKKSSFDVVVSSDVLEHILPEKRKRFLDEHFRVSRDVVIVGAPFDGRNVNLAEKILHRFILDKYRIKYGILEEHLKNKIPNLDKTTRVFNNKGLSYAVLPNGYLYNWLFMILVNFHLEWMDMSPRLLQRINEFYNRNFYHSDNKNPSYRKIIVTSKKSDNGKVEGMKGQYLDIEEDKVEKIFNLELANLLMKIMDLESVREKEKEAKNLKWAYEDRIKSLKEENLEKIQQFNSEIRRLNSEIAKIHISHKREMGRFENKKDIEIKKANDEIKKLNKEIEDINRKSRKNSNLMIEGKRKEHADFSSEVKRLNDELKTINKDNKEKLDTLLVDKDKDRNSLSLEIKRLNDEKIKERKDLTSEVKRLNEELKSLNKDNKEKLDTLLVDKDKERNSLSLEIKRLND
ncbi:MAG: methyltransferase domain-containing protein, partial [Candidatus Omnitrophica bacterium]|nr:methyltransferase domain-containing protein [Candidatus Omnitrophota bacterium]